MKPAAFEYHAPKTIDEAIELLSQHAPNDGRILAGGQSRVPTMAFRLARPTHLIDINNIIETIEKHAEAFQRTQLRDLPIQLFFKKRY